MLNFDWLRILPLYYVRVMDNVLSLMVPLVNPRVNQTTGFPRGAYRLEIISAPRKASVLPTVAIYMHVKYT